MSTPLEQSSPVQRSIAPVELAVACGACALALALSAVFEVYDSRSRALRVGLTAIALVLSFALSWLGLLALRKPPSVRSAGALWATLPSCLLLSQVAYIGTLLVPLEIIAAALLLNFRTRTGMRFALLLTSVVRIAVLGAVLALRHAF